MTQPALSRHVIGDQLRVSILSLGATIQDLRVRGSGPLVLGYADPQAYLNNPHYLGAMIGRVANRIAGAQVDIDAQTYRLNSNTPDGHMLHGGVDGSARRNWTVTERSSDHITLRDVLPDGHMGFPGQLTVFVTYRVIATTLEIDITATTTATTLCNFATHSYWTLGAPCADDLSLHVAADGILPTDQTGIPTGKPQPVEHTRFDRHAPVSLGDLGPVDHNFCLSGAGLRPVATLCSSAFKLTLETDAPGLQVYSADSLTPVHPTLPGQDHAPRAGAALEPQHWPDAPHHPAFPSILLRPSETYRQRSRWSIASI